MHRPVLQDGSFFMKQINHLYYGVAAVAFLVLSGCATPDPTYTDEAEYSSMPWATPESWENGSSIPGLSGQNGY
jgi:hypothetical protein